MIVCHGFCITCDGFGSHTSTNNCACNITNPGLSVALSGLCSCKHEEAYYSKVDNTGVWICESIIIILYY